MSQQVGSLYLEMFLDPSRYYDQLADAEKRSREIGARIERTLNRQSIRPRVDDRELTRLNQHLDLKVRHYNQVRSHFASNPLRVRVDSRQLSDLNKSLAEIPAQKTITIKVESPKNVPDFLDKQINVTIKYDSQSIKAHSRSIADAFGSELEKVGDRVVKGIKKATNKGIIGTIFSGFLSGIGDEVAKQFTRGAVKQGQKTAGRTVSSIGSDAVVKTVQVVQEAKKYAQAFVSTPIQNKKTQSTSPQVENSSVLQLQNEIKSLRSQIDAFKQQKTSQQKQQLSQFNKREILEPIGTQFGVKGARQLSKQELINEILQKVSFESLRPNLPMSVAPSKSVMDSVQKRSALDPQSLKMAQSESLKSISSRSKQALRGSSLADLSNDIEREYQIVLGLLSKDLPKDVQSVLQGAKLQLGKARAIAIRNAVAEASSKASSVGNASQQTERQGLARVSQPSGQQQLEQNYKTVAQALATAQGANLTSKNIPELVIDEAALRKMGADAFYDTERNQILISKQLEKALKSAPQQLAKNREALKTLAHELRHAFQSDFGNISLDEMIGGKTAIALQPRSQASRSAIAAAKNNIKVMRQSNPNMPLRSRVGLENLEIDAYSAERYSTAASAALNGNQPVVASRSVRQRLDEILKALTDFVGEIDTIAPQLRASFTQISEIVQNNVTRLGTQFKQFINNQINPNPQTVFSRQGVARVAGLPTNPAQMKQAVENALKYGKVLEYSARTMPEGSKETSGQRFVNQVIPRSLRSQAGFGKEVFAALLEDLVRLIPDVMQSPLIKKALTYQMKFEVKGWTDVIDLLYKDISKLFQGLEKKAGSQKYFGELLQQMTGGMKNLSLTAVAAAGSFFRFFSMLKYVGYLNAINAAVIATVTAFEALNRRFTLTSKSAAQAQASLSGIMKTTSTLALDRTIALEGATAISSGMRARLNSQSALDSINNAALMSARVYGVNPQDQQQIMAGFASLSQDQILSEGSFQQLQQSVPDIYAIGARAAGTSEQGLRQGLQQGYYSSSDFLPVLSQQIQAEMGTKTSDAMDTMSAANQRLANSFESLQLAFADFALPFNKFQANAFASAVEMAANGVNLLINVLSGLAYYGVTKFAQSLIRLGGNVLTIAKSIPFVSTAILAFAKIAQQVASNIVPILSKMLKELLLFQLVVDVFTIASMAMKDSSGEIGKSSANILENLGKFQKALKETRESAKEFAKDLPKSFSEINGKSYLEDTFFGGLLPKDAARDLEKGLSELDKIMNDPKYSLVSPSLTRAEKEIKDKGSAADRIVSSSNSSASAITEQINLPDSELKRLAEFDKQVDQIQKKRNALAVVDPNNRGEFERLRREEERIVKESSKVRKPIDALSGSQTSIVKGLQDTLDEYDRLASERLITQDEYIKRMTQVEVALLEAEKAQEAFNAELRSTLTPLQSFERAWARIVGNLESAKMQLQLIANQSRVSIAIAEQTGQITPGQSNFVRDRNTVANLQGQVNASQSFVRQGYAELSSKGGEEVFAHLGVTGATSETEIRGLADKSEGFPMQKMLLEKLAEVRSAELSLSDLAAQLAEARSQAQKNLVELNKQVADYYRGISRAAQQQSIEMQRLAGQVSVSQQQNKLRSALLGGYDTIVSQFIDSIIESIGQFNQVGDRALETQSQLLQNRFGLEDTLRSGVELSRSLPTVPIKLDFSQIPTDNNVAELRKQVDDAVDGSDRLTSAIADSTTSADDLYKQLLLNVLPIDEARDRINDVEAGLSSVTKQSQSVEESLNNNATTTNSWQESLSSVNGIFGSINSGVSAIAGFFNDLVKNTFSWVDSLTKGDGILVNIIKGFTGLLSGGAAPSGGNIIESGVNAVKGFFGIGDSGGAGVAASSGIVNPVKGGVYTSGYGMRTHPVTGQRAMHGGLDIGHSQGIGTPILAPTSGVVSRIYSSKYGGNSLELKSIDSAGKEIIQSFLHLSATTAKVGQAVKQGEEIAKMGNTGRSTGPHLHWEVKVNGSRINPKDFLKMNVNIPSSKGSPTSTAVAGGSTSINTSRLNTSAIARNNKLQSLVVADSKGNIISQSNGRQSPASPASTIKLIIGDLATDKLNPDQKLTVNRNAVAEYEEKFKAGQSYSVRQLLSEMLKESNNTAANVLVQGLGGFGAVNSMAKAKGYRDSSVNNFLSPTTGNSTGTSNQITARDATKAMADLLNDGSAGGQIASSALRQTRNFSYAGEAGGKIGNNSKVIGNVGIVNINGSEYIVTAYANVDGNKLNNRKLITNATNEISKGLMSGTSSRASSPTPAPQVNAGGQLITKYGHLAYREASKADLQKVGNQYLDKEAAAAFKKMAADAAQAGVQLSVVSGFRSVERQKQVFESVRKQRGQTPEQRAKVSAPPGFSQHHTGLALDINSTEASFGKTPAFKWLQNNASKYGFTMPFTKGNSQGIDYEPWHWMFQGTARSRQIGAPLRSTGSPQALSAPMSNGISRGGNKLSQSEYDRLTPLGKQLYQLQQDPRILAAGDTVARAEGTDFRSNSKNFGYSMMIGGEHDVDLSRHPFAGNSGTGSRIRPYRHNSTASGRYQMMDFNYSRALARRQNPGWDSDLSKIFKGDNPGSFSPGVQDLYFTASLKSRGVLDEVLAGNFQGAFSNPAIASHYASLQSGSGKSAYRGQGTPEGQLKNTVPFAQQRLQARLREGRPVTVAANNYTAATPGQMRSGIGEGMQLASQTAERQQGLIQQQGEADQIRLAQESVRRSNQALNQYKRSQVEQQNQLTSRTREVTDFGLGANRNPSDRERLLQDSTQIRRQIDDLTRDRRLDIENRQKQIQQAQDALSSGALNGSAISEEVKVQLQKGIEDNQKAIPLLEKQISDITAIGERSQKDLEKIFSRNENLKRQAADFEAFQSEINVLQKKAEEIQSLQQSNPTDPRLKDLPKLQEMIELKQADLDLDKAIADQDAKLYGHSITNQERDRQVELLKQDTIQRKKNAEARRAQAEAELVLQQAQRDLEVRSQMTGYNNEYLQNQIQLRQLGKGGRNPVDIQREIALQQNEMDYAQKQFEIANNRNRTPEERNTALESIKQLQQQKNEIANAEYARSQEDNAIAARNIFNQSNTDIVSAQASRARLFGQDNKARKLEKGVAIFQQQTAFQDQLKELERLAQTNEEVAKSADLIRANYEELNQMKLDDINNQFNEFLPAIQELKGATQGFIGDLLKGGDALGNLFNKLFDYVTNLAAEMITKDLFGSLLGGLGGGKGKTADFGGGGFDIGSLFGGLFGGLFYNGGYVPNYAKGYNPLADALSRERSQTGRKAYVAVLSAGERVLNYDETRKFNQMGGDRILRMADGGTVGAVTPAIASMGSNTNVNVSVTVPSEGGKKPDSDRLGSSLKNAIVSTIINEKRPGGSLYGV
jgi:LAS superfamily LD-carboxypeptidase LdcB/murein DD-endopeptidase MepM/ murein hydrolase activator NlpD/muramidase (phage lysozyme)